MRRLAPALILALALAAPASGRVVATTSPYPGPELRQGPSLENGVVSWLTVDCITYCPRNPLYADRDGDRVDVRVKRPGDPARVVARGRNEFYSSGPNSGSANVEFRASDSHVAVERTSYSSDEFEGDFGGSALRAGPFGASRLTIVGRCNVEGYPRSRALALSGALLSYEATPCRSTSTLAVRDLASETEWRLEPPPGLTVFRLSAAGDYVAIALADGRGSAPSSHVVVLDVTRREIRYELDVPGPLRLDGIDVARDGSLAILTDRAWRRCNGRVVRYSAGGDVQAQAGRVCELVATLPAETLLMTTRTQERRILALPVQPGAGLRTLVAFGRRRPFGADADRGRLVWALERCSGGATIHVDSVRAGPRRPRPC